mmetsp:Transcript_64938/g.172595  ORF Transcript_64938/g.172595 Transcript_64938/m.172595 type:complete len:996 (-) Transcript_64938:233-3220(-)
MQTIGRAMGLPVVLGAALPALVAGGRLRRGAAPGALALEQAELRGASAEDSSAQQLVTSLIKGTMSMGKVVGEAAKDVNLTEAERRLSGQLPDDIKALLRVGGSKRVKTSGTTTAKGEFSEESLAKARTYLNGMVEKSVDDLDKVTIECKEFEERNRETFSQVSNDIKRISGQISDLRRKQIGSNEEIREQSRMHKETISEKEAVALRCHQTSLEKAADLKLKEDDLAVFDFILAATKCTDDEETAEFVQLRKHNHSSQGMSVCSTQKGELELFFNDPKVQRRFEKLLTPSARKTIHKLLGKAATQHGSFVELRSEEWEQSSNFTTTTPVVPTITQPDAPVRETADQGGQWKKCVNGKPDCGLLHDTMAIEWGTYRDLVDELKYEMGQDKAECTSLDANLNEQLVIIGEGKTKAMEMLAETISNIQEDSQEKTEKTEQYHELEAAYRKKMGECKMTMEEILYTNICAVRKIRDSLLTSSEVSPPEKIDDCDVEDWTPGDCSVDCDDTCPQDDPYKCGGWQTLTRGVVTEPNEYGVKCPALMMTKKCNQFKCAVDCGMSEWSGWSGCSAECEGGEQQRTRSILVKPANGGQECDTTLEAQACNTGGCDRDCTLSEWGAWSPCTMACGGGMQERVKSVLVPIRALGKCPEKNHPDRLETQQCNTQECVGDEICIAKQDLIIAVDASGSLRESGFEVLRNFVANFTGRYQSTYYGAEAMHVGVIMFGNGEVNEDGTISKAEMVEPLTTDMAVVREKVLALTWQRGITNMAQAFSLAQKMFREGGREDAQSALMVITDGKPSMKFATSQQVEKLKEMNVHMYFAPIAEFPSRKFDVLKGWASEPWETNYERVPGLLALSNNFDMFGQRLVAKFCPNSFSPSQEKAKAEDKGYMLIHEYGYPDSACGMNYRMGVYATIEDCMLAVRDYAAMSSFSYVHSGRMLGTCYAETLEVTDELWASWSANLTAPECPNGGWTEDPYSDTFAINPSSVVDLSMEEDD